MPETKKDCAITGNQAQYYGGGLTTTSGEWTITNSILWGNIADRGHEILLSDNPFALDRMVVSHCVVQGGSAEVEVSTGGELLWLEGNIEANPLLAGGDDFHLTAGSPCIDAGTDAGIVDDIDGDSRPTWAGFDIGSDEFTGAILSMETAYEAGSLSLDFTLGTTEPTTWVTHLILITPAVLVIPIWTVPLPVFDTLVEVPVSFPFPAVGVVGVDSRLYTGEGKMAQDRDWFFAPSR